MFFGLFGKKTSHAKGDYGKKDESGLLARGTQAFLKTHREVPFLLSSVIPFPRFIANQLKFLYDHAPVIGMIPIENIGKKVKPKYKQVTQKELDAKIKERSKPKTKPDPLKDYRRGEGTKLGKDTRITKKLKKSGFTEDRLARLRKQHAEFKARRKKK